MRTLISVFLILVAASVDAQKIAIDWIELSGNKVIVHYDLEDTNAGHLYQVTLLSSQDNFTTPLAKVSGDVGQGIQPGTDKKIIWDITNELGAFAGNLRFELRGRIFVPFVRLTAFKDGKTFKRGRNVQLNWTSGNTAGTVNIELFKGQKRYSVENNYANSGRYDWHISSGQKTGSGYRLRFTNSKDRNDYVETNEFTIKPQIPVAFKFIGVAAMSAVVYYFISKDPDTTLPGEKSLPAEPGLPPDQ